MTTPWSTSLAAAAMALGASVGMSEEQLAVKTGLGIAGFVGGIISLAFINKPTFRGSAITMLAGGAVGFYLSPLVTEYFSLGRDSGFGVAMLAGFVAMPLFGGIHVIANRFQKSPVKTISDIWGNKDG
jgi:hypothetical protein